MLEFYPQIKLVHVAAVLFSGALFCLRGAFAQAGADWAMAAPLRYLSYTIDTVLLTAALMLLTILPSGNYANGWLTIKLFLLVVYVLLGTLALKRGRTPRTRRLAYVGAVLVFLIMLTVARAHHPLGPWLLVRSGFA